MKDISIISIEGVDYNVEDKVARSRQSVQSDWLEEDTSSGAYIKNKPTIPVVPTNVSDFVNDAGYLTEHQDISGKVDKEQGKGLSTNDYTTAEKAKLANLPTDDQLTTQMNSKANSADVYTKTQTDAAIQEAVEDLGGSVESVTVNGTKHTPDTNGDVDLGNLRGQDGNSGVASADGVESVNNLNGGTTDTTSRVYVLGANQGKRLRDQIDYVYARMQAMYSALGNIAFWDGKPAASTILPDLDWGNPKHTVTLSLNLTNAVAKHNGVAMSNGASILVEEGSTLTLIVEAASGYMLTSVTSSTTGATVTDLGNGTNSVELAMGGSNVTLNIEATADVAPSVSVSKNLTGVEVDSETQNVAYNQPYELTLKRHKYYFPLGTYPNNETLTVTMGETDITSSVWDASTGKISIAHVTGAVVITVAAVSYIKYNYYLAENDGSGTPETGYAITDCYIKIPSNMSDYTFFLKPGLTANDSKCGLLEYNSSFVRNENWTQKYLGSDSSITHPPKSGSEYLRLSMFMDGGTIKSGAWLKMNSKSTTLFDTTNGLQGCTVYYNGVEATFPAIS